MAARVVGSSVAKRIAHPLDPGAVDGPVLQVNDADDSAHVVSDGSTLKDACRGHAAPVAAGSSRFRPWPSHPQWGMTRTSSSPEFRSHRQISVSP
jgi:hypothetical protein